MYQKIINYIQQSSLERDKHGNIIGFFPKENKSTIHFRDESYVLLFGYNVEGKFEYMLLHRDTRERTILSESEFFSYLDILIEMDRLRQERTKLRLTIINKEIINYQREKKLNALL